MTIGLQWNGTTNKQFNRVIITCERAIEITPGPYKVAGNDYISVSSNFGNVMEVQVPPDYENTVVVFTADHGDMAGAHGFNSKGSYMYDEIYRIPMMVRLPGSNTGQRIASPVHLMDITATLMHLMCGDPVDRMATHSLHGRSLLPLMSGEVASLRDVHYAEYSGDWYGHYSSRMVTDGKWKLVWNLSDLCELYNLEVDPYELTNLFYDPAHVLMRDGYFRMLKDEASRTEDRQLAMLDPSIEGECLSQFRAGIETIGRAT